MRSEEISASQIRFLPLSQIRFLPLASPWRRNAYNLVTHTLRIHTLSVANSRDFSGFMAEKVLTPQRLWEALLLDPPDPTPTHEPDAAGPLPPSSALPPPAPHFPESAPAPSRSEAHTTSERVHFEELLVSALKVGS